MWDRREFIKKMKDDGWQKVKGPGDGWVHKQTRKPFEGYNGTRLLDGQMIENWRIYAEAEQTPPPF